MTGEKKGANAEDCAFRFVRWAQKQVGITNPVHANVLVAVALRTKWHDKEKRYLCFPSHQTLAADTRYSERAVRQALKWLEEEGYLERERKHRNNGSRTSDRIFLLLDRVSHHRQDVPVGSEPPATSEQSYRNPVPNLPAGDSALTSFEQPGEEDSPRPPDAGGHACSEKNDRISEREALVGYQPERPASRRLLGRQADRGYGLAAQAADGNTRTRFERLWSAYPASGRVSANRTEALARFAALGPAEQETAIRAAAAEATVRAEHRSQAKALHRWLRDERWRNSAVIPLAGALGTTASASDTRVFVREGSSEWRAWEAHHRTIGRPMPTPTRLAAGEGWRFPSALPPTIQAAA